MKKGTRKTPKTKVRTKAKRPPTKAEKRKQAVKQRSATALKKKTTDAPFPLHYEPPVEPTLQGVLARRDYFARGCDAAFEDWKARHENEKGKD